MLCWLSHCQCMGLILVLVSLVRSLGEFHKSSQAGTAGTVVRRSRSRDGETCARGQEIGRNCSDLERASLLLPWGYRPACHGSGCDQSSSACTYWRAVRRAGGLVAAALMQLGAGAPRML